MTRSFSINTTIKTGGMMIFAAITAAGSGCTALDSSGGGGVIEPPTILGSSVEPAGTGNNDSFDQAESLTASDAGSIITYSNLAELDDVDIFDLGAVDEGEVMTVGVASEGDLDPALGLFDTSGYSLIVNDDLNYFGGDWNANIELVVRRSSGHLYAAVARSPKSVSIGSYSLTVSRSTGSSQSDRAPQVVYLNFDGADEVVIGPRDPVNVPEFDPARISSAYEDHVEEMMVVLTERIRADFVGLQVLIVASHEQSPPPEPYSTVYFGAYDPALLGVAENVDEFNASPAQPAIVFVDTFAAFSALAPSVEEMAQALANVASHEIGHLIGLNHTHDTADLMDISASLRDLLSDQSFSIAPLDASVFPMGEQDSIGLIVEAVGGDVLTARAAAKTQRAGRIRDNVEPTGPAARSYGPFSSRCGCASSERNVHY